jgi:1-deoxy-D-xylulose-5-phosphate synthase
MLYTAVEYRKGPIALRYPRGSGAGVPIKPGFDLLPIGKGEVLREGTDIALLPIGGMVLPALAAADLLASEGISCLVANMRFIKPIDTELIGSLARRFSVLVTLEDNTKLGGFGGAVAEFLAESGNEHARLATIAIPDRFIEHGTPQELHADLGLDAQGIARKVRGLVRPEEQGARLTEQIG